MNIARILLWVGGAALAGLVGLSSEAIVNQVKRPSLSAAIGVGPAGETNGNRAFASYAIRQREDPKAAVSPHERELALDAYRSEPLSSAALGILILSFNRADEGKWHELLDLGGKLTRRSTLITSASVEAAARRNDESSFFRWLSRAILTKGSLRTTYVRAMAQATARPEADIKLAPVLGSKPSWSDRYWKTVIGVPQSLVNAAKLRIRLAGAPWRQTEIRDTDGALALNLARDGHFDMVERLAVSLGRAYRTPRGAEDVAFSDFSQEPQLPPFDWQLASSGNLGATMEAEQKRLSISAIAGAHGSAARQLVKIEPGDYTVSWELTGGSQMERGALTVQISCAEQGRSAAISQVALLPGRHQSAIAIPPTSCRWYWLSVGVDVPDMSQDIDVQLKELRLRRSVAVPIKSDR